MKANAVLKYVIPVLLLVVGIFVFFIAGGKKTPAPSPDKAPELSLTKEEAQVLGVEGDTPNDTLATVVAQMKGMRADMETVRKQNTDLEKENNRLRDRERNVETRINQAVDGATKDARKDAEETRAQLADTASQAKNILTELQEKFNGLGSSPSSVRPSGKGHDELPVGLGLESGDGNQFSASTGSLIWIDPSDGVATDARGNKTGVGNSFTFPNAFQKSSVMKPFEEIDQGQKNYRAKVKGERDLDKAKSRHEETREVYTIAENSTLMGSVAMTALIGRVPIDGSVNDPYPFKVLVGRDNLAANGFELPHVAGAVMSGTATGDWTLSCVRGQVESITFVFDDGTIRTVPEPEATVRKGQASAATSDTKSIRGGLGYLSDPQGIPCVSGQRRSNAQEYLTNQTLLTAAGAGVASLFSKEDGTTNSGSGTTVSDRNGALNAILSGGIQDMRSWMNKLYGQAFAAVYVPPQAQVAVHIDHELLIDYEPHGRKVDFNADKNKISDLD